MSIVGSESEAGDDGGIVGSSDSEPVAPRQPRAARRVDFVLYIAIVSAASWFPRWSPHGFAKVALEHPDACYCVGAFIGEWEF